MKIEALEELCNEIDSDFLNEGVRFGLKWLGAPEMVCIMNGQPIKIKDLLETPMLVIQTIDYWLSEFPDEFLDEGLSNMNALRKKLLGRIDIKQCPQCNEHMHIVLFSESKNYAKMVCSTIEDSSSLCNSYDGDWYLWDWCNRRPLTKEVSRNDRG